MGVNEFLTKAKRSTYAAGGDNAGVTLLDGATELTYFEPPLVYRDRYYGWDPFSGEEVIQENGQVIWLMNYYGFCIQGETMPSQVYSFLVKALGKITPEKPFRGPNAWSEGDWSYRCRSIGNVHGFRGSENIQYRQKHVYFLRFHGGDIKSKS